MAKNADMGLSLVTWANTAIGQPEFEHDRWRTDKTGVQTHATMTVMKKKASMNWHTV